MINNPNGGICEGMQSVQVQLQNFGKNNLASATIHWSINGIVQSNVPWIGSLLNSASISVTLGNYDFNSAGNIYINSWTTNPNGFIDSMPSNDSAMSLIIVSAPPAAKSGAKRDICFGDGTQIGAPLVNDNTYVWSSKPIGFESFISNPSVYPTVTTTYYLTEKNSAGCSKSDSVVINVLPVPIATWKSEPNDPRQYKFKPTVTTYASYHWSFGDGDTSLQVSPEHTYAADGTFKVRLIVKSANGCTSTYDSSITITTSTSINNSIIPDLNLQIFPNPFNQQTSISYNLSKATIMHIDIVNLVGKTIAVLADGNKSAGKNIINLSSETYAIGAGTYILRIFSDGNPVIRKIVKID